MHEWSGDTCQRQIVDWTVITDEASLNSISATPARNARRPAPTMTALDFATHEVAMVRKPKRELESVPLSVLH